MRSVLARNIARVLCSIAMIAMPSISPQAATPIVVESTGNPKPAYAKETEPDALQLIETWRASNAFMPGKTVDRERFEIVDRRVVVGKFPRAFLQFRIGERALGARVSITSISSGNGSRWVSS